MPHFWIRDLCLDHYYSTLKMSEHDKGTLQTGPNARQRGYAGDLSQMEAPVSQ